MTQLREAMRNRAYERYEKYTTEAVDRFPPLRSVNSKYMFLGNFSWTAADISYRWLLQSAVVDLFGIPQTPTEVARDYLYEKYPEPARRRREQIEELGRKRTPPIYARRGRYPDMVYADIRSAYWSIMLLSGWDVDYWPGRMLGRGFSVSDFPLPNNKPSRNTLVTAGLPSPTSVWDGQQVRLQTTAQRLINEGLWAWCQDVLNAIGWVALDYGAVYVHTDGYIMTPQAAHKLSRLVSKLGLHLRIDARGEALVFGIGSYKVGAKNTKRALLKNGKNADSIDRTVDRMWTFKMLSMLARNPLR